MASAFLTVGPSLSDKGAHSISYDKPWLDVTTNRNYTMKYEGDEAKRQTNIQKHGIDFRGIEKVFASQTVTVLDDRIDYGEPRFVTLGLLQDQVVVIAHTETAEAIRIISVRKATKHEEASYFEIAN